LITDSAGRFTCLCCRRRRSLTWLNCRRRRAGYLRC